VQRLRQWDPPILQQKIVGLPSVSVVPQQLAGYFGAQGQGVIEATGRHCNYDVWIQAPNTWANVLFRLELKSMDLHTVVGLKRLIDIENPIARPAGASAGSPTTTTAPAGIIEGILFSIRGRAADRIQLFAINETADEDLEPAKFSIWAQGNDGDSESDRNSRASSNPYAPRHQWRSWSNNGLALFGLTTGILPANGLSNRSYLASLTHTTDDPVVRVVTIENRNFVTGAPIVPAYTYLIGGTVSDQHIKTFDPPLRNRRGDNWQLTISGLGGVQGHRVGASLFEE
jgi:hypothetical protein